MAQFKIYDCDFGIKIAGISYEFTHVNELTIEDPENTKLIRGSNAGNKVGLVYKEGIKEPKKISVSIMDMTIALKEVLDAAYDARTRLDVYCISKTDGSSKMAKNAVLSQIPQQLSINDGADSMNVKLDFESFDLSEVHKT
jgi:hypothetical protein